MKRQSPSGPKATGIKQYTIVFDGGSKGNPGRGYGSYRLYGPDGENVVHEELNFDSRGNQVTNNEAEYLSLIRALQQLATRLGDSALTSDVLILGDSQLVINQLGGSWKVRKSSLQALHRQATELLRAFGAHELRWHDRSNSVRLLGH